jgi:hypothetical protein
VRVSLRYKFLVESLPSGACALALEAPSRYSIALNGTMIDHDAEAGWWVDRSLRRIPFDPALLKMGRNELFLDCDYDEHHPGFEIVYLLGSFGTKVDGKVASITAAPATLALGDWVDQGLAFYSGSVSYRATIQPRREPNQRVFVEVSHYAGVAVRVLVNGTSAGVVGWDPHEVDITDLVGAGPTELRVEVLGHRRNSHGPLHMNEKWPRWTGPGQFAARIDGYQLVPCGLMEPPELVVRG